MKVRLQRPANAPNFCYLVVEQRTQRLVRGPNYWEHGADLKRPQWPRDGDPDFATLSRFVQSDTEYCKLAEQFGWSPRSVQRRHGCRHAGTDGSVTCDDCGVTAAEFTSAARQYLDDNVGRVVDGDGA